jgi:hypothetical protein
MVKKDYFSHQHQDLAEIHDHHTVITEATQAYFKPKSGGYPERFVGYTKKELQAELKERLEELDRASAFNVLVAVEAVFRIDYLRRSYKKKKDGLSRSCREIYKKKGVRVSLVDDILDLWKQELPSQKHVLGEIKGALNYRHWLAHGRYWNVKLGKNYDYESLYLLAQTLLSSFEFEGIDE